MQGLPTELLIQLLLGDLAPVTIENILDELLLEYWDARYGYALTGDEVDTWTGRFASKVLTAAALTRPKLEADGTDFNAIPVIKTGNADGIGDRFLYGTGLNLAEAGTFPYVMSVMRQRATSATLVQSQFGIGATSGTNVLVHQLLNLETDVREVGNEAQVKAFTGAGSTQHIFESWIDGTNLNVSLDGVDATAALVGGGASAISAVGVGCLGTISGSQTSETSHAVHIICSAKPSQAQRVALRALLTDVWF